MFYNCIYFNTLFLWSAHLPATSVARSADCPLDLAEFNCIYIGDRFLQMPLSTILADFLAENICWSPPKIENLLVLIQFD